MGEKSHQKKAKSFDSLRFISAIIIVILVFLCGFLLGNWIASGKLNELTTTRTQLNNLLIGLEMKEKLMDKSDLCDFSWDFITKERSAMGRRLDLLEARFGKKNPDVIAEKEIYQLIEIRTLLLVEKVKDECDSDINTILFFYTNREEDEKGSIDDCVLQGYALDELYKKYPKNVSTFAFDINTENPALETLKQKYNITRVPTLVLNKQTYEGIKKVSELEDILELS